MRRRLRSHFTQPQPLFQILAQFLFAERFDMKLERQIEIQRGDSLVPVNKRIVRVLLEQIPRDQTAGVDEVRFQVGVFRHFFV
ncbi:hypothetical protein ISX56_34210, partial [Serratia ureilytica]|nr:hypothetical protein [Serratia ureilytica]